MKIVRTFNVIPLDIWECDATFRQFHTHGNRFSEHRKKKNLIMQTAVSHHLLKI